MSPWAVTSTRAALDYILPLAGSAFFAEGAPNFVFMLLSAVIEPLFSSTSLRVPSGGGFGSAAVWLHLLWAVVPVLRGQHLLARLLCGRLCGAAGITGRPFTPAQTAIRSPSPSVLLHSLSPPSFLSYGSHLTPPPLCARLLYHTLSFTSPFCLSVCLCLASTLPLPFFWGGFATISLPPASHRNTNSSSYNSSSVKQPKEKKKHYKRNNSTIKSPQQQPVSKFSVHLGVI